MSLPLDCIPDDRHHIYTSYLDPGEQDALLAARPSAYLLPMIGLEILWTSFAQTASLEAA